MFRSSRREFLGRAAASMAAVAAAFTVRASAAPLIKCPFCGYWNEDGALFCEQCKSDISSVDPPPPPPTPVPPK